MRLLALLGLFGGEGRMVVYLSRRIKMGGMGEWMRSAVPSPRKPEHHEQRAIEVLGCFRVDMTNNLPNMVNPQRDHLVRHNLGAKAKAV
jgi:hypothetical protein